MSKVLYQVKLRGGLRKGLAQRDLVNEVVLDYAKNNPASTLTDLQRAFPLSVQKKLEIVVDEAEAQRLNASRKQYSIFRGVKLSCGSVVSVCNQWGVANIDNFLTHAKQLGYQIGVEGDEAASIPTETKARTAEYVKVEIGKEITFANIKWRVLYIFEEKHALLISSNVVLTRICWHDSRTREVEWEHSTLRRYLNTKFYDSLGEEKHKLEDLIIKNPSNPYYGGKTGQDTREKISILSMDEVFQLFGDSRAAIKDTVYTGGDTGEVIIPKDYISDNKDAIRRARDTSGKLCPWWLRTPGVGDSIGQACATYICGNGTIQVRGEGVHNKHIGVRPVVFLSLLKPLNIH